MSRHLINRFTAVLMTAALLFSNVATISAAVWTDQLEYSPGSLVTINGDGMNPGEGVSVDVFYPDGTLAQHHEVTADENGNFTDTYALPSADAPVEGTYTVVARGLESGNEFTTTFEDACDLTVTSDLLASPVQYSDIATVTGTLSGATAACSDGINSKTIYLDVDFGSDGSYTGGDLGVASSTTAAAGSPAAYTITWQVPLQPGAGGFNCGGGDISCYRYQTRFVGPSTKTSGHQLLKVSQEDTATTYNGDLSGTEGGSLNLSAHVADADGGAPPSSEGIFGPPDANLASTVAGTDGVKYQLWDGALCTGNSAAGPVYDDLDSSGDAAGASMSLAVVIAGAYYMKTTYLGNTYYNGSSDCDSIEVAEEVEDAEVPTVTTEIHLYGNDPEDENFDGGNVPLASEIHDKATVTTSTNNIPAGSSLVFEFWAGDQCADTIPIDSDTVDLTGGSLSESAESSGTDGQANTDPLHAGDYSFKVFFWSGETEDVLDGEADCETVTVDKADLVDFTTEIHLDGNDPEDENFDGDNVPLGSTLHDKAIATGIGEPGFEPTGDVTFTFYGDNSLGSSNDADCTTTNDPSSSLGTVGLDGSDPGTAESSSSTDPLHAGNFAFDASYEGDDDYNSDTSPCETVTVDPADTTTTTIVRDVDGNDATNGWGYPPFHDEATVQGIDLDGFEPTGDVVFSLYNSTDCTGTPSDETVGAPSSEGANNSSIYESTPTALDPGYWCFQAEYMGSDDYNGSTSAIEPFTSVPQIELKRGTCTFDVDPIREGEQFRLIYTPEMGTAYSKLNASNPGQFFLDVFYIGEGDEDITVNIPFPFVMQGAMPVHFYDGVTITNPSEGVFCYEPGAGLGASDDMVTLQDYVDSDNAAFGEGFDLTIHVPDNSEGSGLIDVRIHLDYGLKWVALGCWKSSSTEPVNANCDTTFQSDLWINDNQVYEFEYAGGTDSIMSENAFKKDPGIAGLVLAASGEPIAGTTVEIWQGTTLYKTVYTDEDGWYMAAFKYTGKAVTFTVKLTAYQLQQSVTLKSNGYAILNFIGV